MKYKGFKKYTKGFFFWHFSISTQPSMTHQDPYHQHPTWSTPSWSNLQVPTTMNPCQTASVWPWMQTRSKISYQKSTMKNWIMSEVLSRHIASTADRPNKDSPYCLGQWQQQAKPEATAHQRDQTISSWGLSGGEVKDHHPGEANSHHP